MKLNTLTTQLLKSLFKSDQGLFIFTLFQRLRLSPKDLFETITTLKDLEYIVEENERVSLTLKGKEFVIHNKLASEKNVNKFENIPEIFKGKRIGINEFYIPKDSSIYKEFIILKPNNTGGTKETSTSEV
jgi:predicted methyltransferase